MYCLKSLAVAATFLLVGTTFAAPSYNAASTTLEISDPDGVRPLSGWLWYPTDASGAETTIAGNPVWADIKGQHDAAVADGQHPLVLLSHGMFGNVYNQGWLATGLARHGFVVAAINHPGTTTRNRDPQQSQALWERSRDLSRIIDQLLTDHALSSSIDHTQIAAAGHSLGGYTAMRLLGAIHDDARHDASCTPNPQRPDCAAMRIFNVGQTEQNSVRLKQSVLDPRVQAVISLDLGGTQAFTPASLKTVTRPVLVIGAERNLQLNQSLESQALASSLPASSTTYIQLPEGGHFDFMGVCTERGLSILREEEPQDAMVCEGGTSERRQKHSYLIDQIVSFLQKQGINLHYSRGDQ